MYRALYRKWRPARFEDVVGQQAIVAALKNQVAAGRVGHAYLFTGVRGTGKTTCAKIFARAVNCLQPQNGDPCGVCPVCRGIEEGSVLDVVEMDAASNNGVDDIRDLRDETAYTPSVCKYKVYIIDEVHMLSTAAFNALLKTLEEPPAHVIFILATTEIQKVPATIRSRCQRYDFTRIPPDAIAARLARVAEAEGLALTGGAADLIARLADGALRDALSILDTCAGVTADIDEAAVRRMAGVTDRGYLFRISDALAAGDAAAALAELAALRQQSVDVKRLAEELIAHYRSLMLAALPGGQELLTGVPPDEEARYLEQGPVLGRRAAVEAIRTLGKALEHMARGADQRIELELALCALAAPQPAAAQAQPVFEQARPAQPAPERAPAQVQEQPQRAQPAAAQAPVFEQAPPPDEGSLPPWPLDPEPAQPAPARPVPIFEQQAPPAAEPPQPPAQGAAPCTSWPEVVARIQGCDPMLYGYLKNSRAYFDGVRVLIDGGKTFRDFIRANKNSQRLIKKLIAEVTGKAAPIGPYEPKSAAAPAHASAEDALRRLEAQGVTVTVQDTPRDAPHPITPKEDTKP